MNERIRELAHEAGLPTYNPQGIPTKLEKFAELIVRECARVSERTGALNEAEYEGEMIADAIREHFGVER